MTDKAENSIEAFEKLKEVARYQYDYFKHMTTLSLGSILIIVAFIEKIFSDPIRVGLAMASIIGFTFSLACSLWILPSIGNLILYISGIRIHSVTGDEKEVIELVKKAEKTLDMIGVFDKLNSVFFFGGILMFLAFASVNFFN